MTTGSTTLPIDPNVKIPAAVLAQSAEADKLHQAAYSQEADPNNPNPEAPPAPAADTQAPPQVTPQVSQPVPAEEPPQRSETIQNGSWEQRYWSLYARLQQAEAGLSVERENNAALRGMLATMQTAPQPQDTPQQQAQSLLSEQERADYGEELLSVVGKKAREELMPVVQPLLDEINSLRQQVGHQGAFVAKSARQSMFDYLSKELPDWRAINKKSEFLAWLDLHDPLSGAKRKDMLKAAFEANQSPRVLAFFQGFLNENPIAPTAGTQQAATPATKTPLESLAAPGRAKTSSAAPEAPAADKPIYTQLQIKQFYADSAQGKYRGREEEKGKIEADIFAAQREGRIRN